MRVFVALELPEPLVAPITRLQAGLTVGRIVPEDNLHLTLAFLGEIGEPQAWAVAEALAEALAAPAQPAVALTLRGLDLFGGRRPNVLFVSAHGPGLAPLHDKVLHAVRAAGVELPRTRFRPHVTLARFGRDITAKDQARLGEFLALNGAFSLPAERADTVTLYRSHLREAGAVHDPLAQFRLTG